MPTSAAFAEAGDQMLTVPKFSGCGVHEPAGVPGSTRAVEMKTVLTVACGGVKLSSEGDLERRTPITWQCAAEVLRQAREAEESRAILAPVLGAAIQLDEFRSRRRVSLQQREQPTVVVVKRGVAAFSHIF